MRYGLILMWMLLWPANPAMAQVSIGIGIGLPSVSIGINFPLYPEFVRVPGYPVYYAPQLNTNYFFYDGMYWVYHDDNWYASYWYNGPWGLWTGITYRCTCCGSPCVTTVLHLRTFAAG